MGRLNEGSPSAAPALKPDDIKHIQVKDKDGSVLKTLTLKRTDREYVHDLCDAYNDASTLRDHEWFVTANGELKLGDKPGFSQALARETADRNERERRRWVREHFARTQPFADAAE